MSTASSPASAAASSMLRAISTPSRGAIVVLTTRFRRFGSGLPPGSESRVFFPITTVFPVVSALKRLRSAEI